MKDHPLIKKVAICLYGQPRGGDNLTTCIETSNKINNFINRYPNVDFDVFFHAWKVQNGSKYSAEPSALHKSSPPSEELKVTDNQKIINQLLEFYNPVRYEYQDSIDNFDLATTDHWLGPRFMNNLISQTYSRNKTRNMLDKYIKETNTKYDIVITCRFDIHNSIITGFELPLEDINSNFIYTSATVEYKIRKVFLDNFLIFPTEIYLNVFNIYDKLGEILNNKSLEDKLLKAGCGDIDLRSTGPGLKCSSESLITASYILEGYDFKDVVFSPDINGNS
jgi:hypothetical protein